MPILFAFVGRPSVPLVEYTKPGVSGNVSSVTSILSKKLPLADGQVSYLYEAYTFHCLTSSSLQFVCLTSQSFSRSVAFQFLSEVRGRFLACYLPSLQSASTPSPSLSSFPSSFSIPLSLQTDFEGELGRLLSKYSTDDERMQRMRDDLAETTDAMQSNIDSVMERGERLELLETKTAALDASAVRFKSSSWELQRGMWWANARLSLISAGAACGGLYLLLTLACGGLTLPSC